MVEGPIRQFGGNSRWRNTNTPANTCADEPKKVAFELRHVTFNHYDANDVASAAEFLQGHTQQLRAIPHKLRRLLNGPLIDGENNGGGYETSR